MDAAHHVALLAGYAAALGTFAVVRRRLAGVWPPARAPQPFAHPWRELGLALAAVAAVLGIGQLYVHGNLITEAPPARTLKQAANQLLIFLPIPLLLALRGHGPHTAWLPARRVGIRVAVGLGAAGVGLFAFHVARGGDETVVDRLRATFRPASLDELVQVFLEDLTIAVLMVRFAAALGRPRVAVAMVGALFAAGHLPAMLADGVAAADLACLALDAALAVAVLGTVQRSADIWWFWPVHFTLDMTQFQG